MTERISKTLAAVPRAAFIPSTIWMANPDGWMRPLHRRDDPDQWAEIVASGESVVTQLDEGAARSRGIWPTSSASAVPIVAAMLEALDVHPGMSVLEIGTGTGYNAALLAVLASSDGQVTSVEIDPDLSELARVNLHSVGGPPVRVVAGDGQDGCSDGAPYDRILATGAVTSLPRAWVEQTRLGGRIVAPWAPTAHPDEPLAVFTVTGPGRAEGRFTRPAAFMPLRGHRLAQAARQQARQAWHELGAPTMERFGVTADAAGTRVWLDDPANVISEPDPLTSHLTN